MNPASDDSAKDRRLEPILHTYLQAAEMLRDAGLSHRAGQRLDS
jgi:hypothetical protein